MILMIDEQIVNAYIEPQFLEVQGGPVVTVEFDAWESVPNLRRHIKGDLRVARVTRYFNFVGYTQLLDLQFLVGNYKLNKSDLLIEHNTSPTPVAFSWSGYEADIEIGDDEYQQGESYFGYSLPEDLTSTRYDGDIHYECFYAYPLFTLPRELETCLGGRP
jgi:hypothetical protein